MALDDRYVDDCNTTQKQIIIKEEKIEIAERCNEGFLSFKSAADNIHEDADSVYLNKGTSDPVPSSILNSFNMVSSDTESRGENELLNWENVQRTIDVKQESPDSEEPAVPLAIYLKEYQEPVENNYSLSEENIPDKMEIKPDITAYKLEAGTTSFSWESCREENTYESIKVETVNQTRNNEETSSKQSVIGRDEKQESNGRKRDNISCKLCDYKCSYNSHLKMHVMTHKGQKPSNCNICDYKCAKTSDMKRHMMTHTGEKPYKCKICEYSFAVSNKLKLHMMKHSGERPYKCEKCEYKCTNSSDLKRHMIIHTGEKPYRCKICDYRCASSSALKKHCRIHTGEKLYTCKMCDYKCARNCTLVRHIRIHTGEKPYKCKMCNYKCAGSSDLKRHERIHTGEKPYKCNACEYKCIASGDLRKHMKTHEVDTI